MPLFMKLSPKTVVCHFSLETGLIRLQFVILPALSIDLILKLPKAQNSAARLIFRTSRSMAMGWKALLLCSEKVRKNA